MTSRTPPQARFAAARCIALSFVAASLLAACAEDDIILPGKREDIRAVRSEDGAPAEIVQENSARAISLGAQVQNTSWPQAPGTPGTRTTNAALRAAPVLAWSVNIGDGDSRKARIIASPVVAGGLIYTLDAATTVTAVSSAGAVVWRRDLETGRVDSDAATGGGLAVADGRLYVSLGLGDLVALDAASGAEVWRQRLESTGSGTPTVVGGIVYLASGDDNGWAIDAETGRVQWQLLSTPDVNNVLGGPAPAVGSELAIFGFGSGELQAVFRLGGLRRWDAAVVGERSGAALANVSDLTGAPVISGNTVYAGNQSGRTVAFDLGSGARQWTANGGAIGPIVPAGDSVFYITDQAQLVRTDAADGSRVWAVDLPKFVRDKPRRRYEVYAHHGPVLAGGRLHVASNDGLLRSFDPVDGSLAAMTEIPGGATTDPVVAGSTLYVVSTRGQLLAFR